MKRATVLIALLAVTLGTATSANARVTIGISSSGDLKAAALASATWGTPACGNPRIETSTPERYQQTHGTGYFEEEASPTAWADENRCVIVLNPDFKIRTAAKRCHVIVHEWGHLTGHEHSTNPRSVMYEEDMVSESLLRDGRKRRWTASGVFAPCSTRFG